MDGQWMTVSLQKPGEAGRRSSGAPGEPGPPLASWIPGCAGVCRPWLLYRLLTPQDGLWFAPDLLAVWSRLSGVGRVTFISCLLAPGGLTCCAVRRLPEGISVPAVSPVGQFP